MKKFTLDTESDDFLMEFDQRYGSAIEMWGYQYPIMIYLIKQAVQADLRIKSVSSPRQMQKLISEGWTLLGKEQNFDSFDAILIWRPVEN